MREVTWRGRRRIVGTSIAYTRLKSGWWDTGEVTYPLQRSLGMGWFLFLGGLFSWLAAFTLAREGYLLAAEGRTPSCNINPFFSCGNVMQSWQARVFFEAPNQLFGVAGYVIPIVVGIALLQGAKLQRWFWRLFSLGMFAAWAFLMWLFYQAVFVIGFLCLYCMVVWVVHTIVWWVFIAWAAKQGLLGDRLRSFGQRVLPYTWLPIVLTFAVIAISIRVQFPLLFPF